MMPSPKKPLLILLGGELGEAAVVRRAARASCGIVCADGGARHAAALHLEPRVVIGDMDSLPARLPRWRGTVYLCDFDEDRSDFDKTARFAAEQGHAEAWVAGGFGGRLDHMLVNLAVAERLSPRIRLTFIGRERAELLEPGPHALRTRRRGVVTLLPASDSVRVTTSGLAYALSDEALERGSRGLSNRALGAEAIVTVHAGRVWAVVGP